MSHQSHSLNLRVLGLLLSMCFVSVWVSRADTPRWFVSPGIKLSYAIGNPSGFTFGWELSVFRTISWKAPDAEDGFIGLALDVDWCKSVSKVHLGIEASQRLVGVCCGPTLIRREGKSYFGFTTTVYSWFVALPYLNYTYAWDAPNVFEVGAFLKIPVQLNGRHYWGGSLGG